jgi:hypothetical protein
MNWKDEIIKDLKELDVDLTLFSDYNQQIWLENMFETWHYCCPLNYGVQCNLINTKTDPKALWCEYCTHIKFKDRPGSNTDFKCTASEKHTDFVQKWMNFFVNIQQEE